MGNFAGQVATSDNIGSVNLGSVLGPASIKKKLKRRNAVEPVGGHMKNNGRLGRNFLRGEAGDAINALLCGAGHNLRKILRQLALLCARIWQCLLRLVQQQNSCGHQQLMAVV